MKFKIVEVAGLIIGCFFTLHCDIGDALKCLDEFGDEKDWIIGYKLPRLHKSHSERVSEGYGYSYVTNENFLEPFWDISNQSIDSNVSVLGYTLSQLYENPNLQNILYVAYNDEPPDRNKTETKGHTKGVFAFDHTSGFWLIHSIPKFPAPFTTSYSYPHSGTYYGQSFLCISLSTKFADKLGRYISYNGPSIYTWNIPVEMEKDLPHLDDYFSGNIVIDAPYYMVDNLTSLAGTNFVVFAKNKLFNKDLYSDLVAPTFKTDLLTETWRNGPNPLVSECSTPNRVENIEEVIIADTPTNLVFPSTEDHSKWAISETESKPWLCIGDINRMQSQGRRGGGTACISNPQLWSRYHKSITRVEQCVPVDISVNYNFINEVRKFFKIVLNIFVIVT